MPTYDLRCPQCGTDYELFLMRMLRDEDRVCPECGCEDVRPGVGGGLLGAGTSAGATTSEPASCGPGAFT